MATKPQEEIRLVPLHEEDDDARYRVRDKHTSNELGKVWGEDLTLEEAHNLKERITSGGRSTTARIESMAIDHEAIPFVEPPKPVVRAHASAVVTKPNHPSPAIANNQARAIAAGKSAANAAKARADKIARDRELAELAAQANALEEAASPPNGESSDMPEMDDLGDIGGESAEFQ